MNKINCKQKITMKKINMVNCKNKKLNWART